jgi:hypothetical protein
MKKRFKEEYQNSKVTVTSPSLGKVTVDTFVSSADEWGKLPEFAFMVEDIVLEDITEEKHGQQYDEMTLGELRELFPDIKATSKKGFLEQIQ